MTPKFRAWHKLHGEMREVYGITFNNKQEITSLLIKGFQPGKRSEFFWYQVMDETDKYDMSMKFEDLFVLMQYTGCRDKNGVEIYEGDILFHPLQGRRKVYYPYSESVASYGLRDIDSGFGNTLQDSHAVWEVIGNIWEDGDLIDS